MTCPDCKGDGYIPRQSMSEGAHVCDTCKGMGKAELDEKALRFVVEWLNPGNKPGKPREALYQRLCKFGKEAEERGRRSENEAWQEICKDELQRSGQFGRVACKRIRLRGRARMEVK